MYIEIKYLYRNDFKYIEIIFIYIAIIFKYIEIIYEIILSFMYLSLFRFRMTVLYNFHNFLISEFMYLIFSIQITEH